MKITMLATVVALVEEICRYRLLPPPELEELSTRLQTQFVDPRALARELLKLGWLTPYQINQLFLGRGSGLLLGQYVLLERLGEGGMGQVFKARHQALGRVVAIKILRREQTTQTEAVQRFEREVRASAQVSHPNIVLAFDANHMEDTYFLVMEYVDGIDLSRLVKRSGPLPVADACDYIRQAALGLQHAHEHGMVHRDIKPSNLLLSPPPSVPLPPGKKGRTVKLLDLGVVRIREPLHEKTRPLTQFGMVMGTPDYIAPEQARNAHLADIRSDLYSLGCTLFYLLAGKPPFPGGMLTEKLLRHQLDEPPPIEGLRPEVPADVAAVVRKLLAKRPQDRYQTPAELAAALAPLAETAGQTPAAPVEATDSSDEPTAMTPFAGTPPPAWVPADQTDSTEIVWSSLLPTVETARPTRRLRHAAGDGLRAWLLARQRRTWWAAAGGGVLLGLLVAVLALAILKREQEPPPRQATSVRRTVEANRPWQDTGVDVVAGTPVTIRASGSWRNGPAACSPRGFPGAPRDRTVLPDAPLSCLLARIGVDGLPFAVADEKRFVPPRSGRLFVQANDLDLQDNRGSLELEIEGAFPALEEGQ
jgi:serine/threonine-protein kinase